MSSATLQSRFGQKTGANDGDGVPSRTKRLEIEGLRTVAALLVAVYHIWLGKVSGGVDVFFVVTGFLITLTLVGHVRREGRIRPFAYLGRLARRVWPMAAVVLAAALVITVVLAPDALRPRNFTEVLASALYYENWFLAANAVDYLNQHDPHTPVQHFWAMSVQGQFYVTWLVVAMLAWLLAARGGQRVDGRRFLSVLGGLIALVGLVSFAWSLIQTADNQPYAYFSYLTRVWEFAVGGLLALAAGRLVLRGWAAGIASWAGLLGLFACGLVLPVEGAFPGVAALWPVTCAALLLVSTREDERSWSGTRLLATPALSWLGGMAFGIYLWHFPILIGYRYVYGTDAVPSLLAGSAMVIAAILLAIFFHRAVEQPVARGWRPGSTKPLIAVALVCSWIAVVGLSLVGIRDSNEAVANSRQSAARAATELGECFGYPAMGREDRCADRLASEPVMPARVGLLDDTGRAYDCYSTAAAKVLSTCRFGTGSVRVALVGTSHAAMLTPLFRAAARERNWQVTVMTGNGCVWSAERAGSPGISDRCRTRIEETEEQLFGGEPFDAVVFAGGRNPGMVTPERVGAAAKNWQALIGRGSDVVVIEDNPRIGEEAARCVTESSEESLRAGACDVRRADATSDPDTLVSTAQRIDAAVVPTLDLYCDDHTCPAVIGNAIVYRDAHHLTLTYERTMAEELFRRLDAHIPSGRP